MSASWSPNAKAIFYEAEVYNDETQQKIRQGLIQHVSVAVDYERLDAVDGQIPHGLHNAELSLVAVPGMPQTNIEVVDNGPNDNAKGTFDEIASTLNDLQEHLKTLRTKHGANGRAVVAPEAMEHAEDKGDFFRASLRDVMRRVPS